VDYNAILKGENQMNLSELKSVLVANKDKNIEFYIESNKIPSHFHLTEVGKVTKKFIDCGGSKRESEKCVLQLWVANDFEHRLKTEKMLNILNLGAGLFEKDDLEVQVEYEDKVISQYSIREIQTEDAVIKINLGNNHTACLAPEKCGVGCCQEVLLTLK
jgi:hypothetical protein